MSSSPEKSQEIQRDVLSDRETTLEALGEAARMWDAAWEANPGGGRLHLPLLAGVRRGRMLTDVDVVDIPEGSSIRLTVEEVDYQVNTAALFFLCMGALGGLILILWPLAPASFLRLVPFGVVMLIGAWLLVASRLRTAGPAEFLDTVEELVADQDDLSDESCIEKAPFRP